MHKQTNDWDGQLRSFGPEDPQVIESLVKQYEQYIYRLISAILNNADEAKDVTQETFIIASRKLAQYQPGTNIKGWLYTIAVNQARGFLRKSRARQTMRELFLLLPWQNAHSISPESSQMLKDQKNELWTAVSELGEKHLLMMHTKYRQIEIQRIQNPNAYCLRFIT